MTIKLEVGKKYVLNNGEVHTCEVGAKSGFKINGFWYEKDGTFGDGDSFFKCSVSHEYVEGKTLKELDVRYGDVVECLDNQRANSCYTIGRTYEINGFDDIGLKVQACEELGLFRIVSRASETPTLWRDMTPEEKGAMLLAEYDGRDIEDYTARGEWVDMDGNVFHDFRAYRIKPQSKVEEVTLYGNNNCAFKMWGKYPATDDTHKITFNKVDGEPDTASIQMEVL